ncbi:MAG: hypothetical protein LQ350_004822 [Teloschistes chrysophthalmus]|nr:MAG: hypothetical protein LQ350_004822 [Niorma chrysophthalma]
MGNGKAKTRAPCTPARRKRLQRLRDPASGRFVSASAVKEEANSNPSSQEEGDRSTPEAPETPDSAENHAQAESLWSLVTPKRLFWDAIVGPAQDQEPSASSSSSSGDLDLDAVMTRLTNSITHQRHTTIIEGSVRLSSPRPHADPRDLLPLSSAEEQELRLAIWPTVQHMVELLSSSSTRPSARPNTPDPQRDYLTQLRGLLNTFATEWQLSGHSGSLPTAFSLEAWNGPIANWRTSHYTNGDLRFPATMVLAHLDIWRSSRNPFSPFLRLEGSPMVLDTLPSPTLPHPRSIVPLHRRSMIPLRRRSTLAPIYDGDRDFGIGPTAAQITAHQSAFSSSTATTNSRPLTQPQRAAWTESFPIHVDPDARHTMEGMDEDLGSGTRTRARRRPAVQSDSPFRDQENLRMNSRQMANYLNELMRIENEENGIPEPEDEADEVFVDSSPSVQTRGARWLRMYRSWDWENELHHHA